MRKRDTGRRASIAARGMIGRRAVVAIALVLSVISAGVILGQRSGRLSHPSREKPSPQPEAGITPASFDPASPSKEYIYSGGSLIATEEPAGSSCVPSISPPSANYPSSGGSGRVSVTAGSGCGWTAFSNDVWITITSGSSGTGNGTVNYSVGSNGGPPRNGSMTIANQTFNVSQSAPGCSYVISPTSASFTASAATGSVGVTAGTGCAWTATPSVTWITITSGSSGSGNGTVNYSVQANSGVARNGAITIADKTFSVTQAGCSFSISPTGQSFTAAGGTGNVSVTGSAGCSWTAISNATWITITSGATGTGNGTTSYSVASNSGGTRSGTITIAGQSFTVTQSGSGGATCDFVSMSPPVVTVPKAGGAFSVSVTSPTPAGCGWTAASNVSWITITSGGSGSGAGTINYTVAAYNRGTVTRQGKITINLSSGMATHSVKQTP